MGLPILSAVVLIRLHSLEPGRTAYKLMRELRLVLFVVGVDVVYLVSARSVILEEVKEAHVESVLFG